MTLRSGGLLAALLSLAFAAAAGDETPRAEASAPAGSAVAAAPAAASTGTDAAAPGCAVERQREACLAAGGSDGAQCVGAARQGADAELRRVLDQLKPVVTADDALLNALAAAQMSWQGWIQRDCETVSADLQGDAKQTVEAELCLYRHTLERAQALWQRHLRNYAGGVPADCLPGR